MESDALQVASAEAEARAPARLRCRTCGSALVHGQQRADLRDATMTAFAAGEIDVLVATTVIEVGIDVPNASVMLIEDAERFGLAQLHQLRGRVGRGAHRSFCILLTDATDELALRAAGGRARLAGRVRDRRGRPRACAAPATCSARGSRACRRCAWPSLFEPRHLRLAERARDAGGPRGRRRPDSRARDRAWRACRPTSRRPRRRATRPDARHRRNRPVACRSPRRAARATRPITDRVKETLFGILGDRVPGRPRAGPLRRQRRDRDRGAVARRGAASTSSSAIGAALAALRDEPRAHAPVGDAARVHARRRGALPARRRRTGRGTSSSLDPPYEVRAIVAPLRAAACRTWRPAHRSWSSTSGAPSCPSWPGLAVVRQRRFGETMLTFLEVATA